MGSLDLFVFHNRYTKKTKNPQNLQKMAAKVAKTIKKSANPDAKKRRRKPNNDKYTKYVQQVLKQVHPDNKISSKTLSSVNSMVKNVLDDINAEMTKLVWQRKGKTCTERDVQTAVRLIFPGELGKHAVSEGTKAVAKWNGKSSEE